MDNLRRPRGMSQRQSVDGFFTSSSNKQQTMRRGSHPGGLRTGSMPSQNRPVGDFRRPNGLHPVPGQRVRAGSRSLPPINMALPEEQARKKHGRHGRSRRKSLSRWGRIRVWSFRSAMAILLTVLVVGGILFAKGYISLHKVFQGGSTAAALKANVDPSLLKGEGDGRVNVLLLGIGGDGHDGADLTDTIMIASIDPINNKASLLSVPRDLWVKMPNNFIANYQKINAAYESGKYKYLGEQSDSNSNKQAIDAGFSAADSTVEQVLGVPIHYNMLVNFQAFHRAIDTVGGVSVNVPTQLWDPTIAWENHNNPVIAKAGIQQMNGAQALLYVRSRETSSDFARADRQRAVMVALKDKVMTLGTLSNPIKVSQLLGAFGNNVQSDISIGDMMRMVQIMKKIPNSQIQSDSLAGTDNSYVTTGNINGISVVEPKAGLGNYTAIQTYVRGVLKDGYIAKENANITILNGSTTPGLATAKATELKSYGYNVGTVTNAPTSDYATTKIVDLTHGADKYTLHYLQGRFAGTSVTTTAPTGITPGSANIIIILGQNETLTSQT